jgi:hypothetical protein
MRMIRFLCPLAAAALLAGCPLESGQERATTPDPDGGNASADAGAGGSREIPWDWDHDGGLGGSGGSGGRTGGSGGGGATGSAGAGGTGTLPPATPPLSNVPGATWVDTGPSGLGSGLRIKNARLTLETISTTFQEWLAEVVNEGPSLLCLAKVTAQYKDASGTVLAKPLAFVDGPPYKGLSSVSDACLAPGDHGALWDLDQVPSTFSLSQVKRVEYVVDVIPFNDVPHPSAPVVTPGQVIDRYGTGTGWVLRGTLRAVATINNYGVHVYPFGSDGMILASLTSSNPGALLAAGSSWSFETSSAKQRFTNQLIFARFIDGAPRSPAVPRTREELDFQQRDLDRRTAWDRVQAVAAARELARGLAP